MQRRTRTYIGFFKPLLLPERENIYMKKIETDFVRQKKRNQINSMEIYFHLFHGKNTQRQNKARLKFDAHVFP